MYTLQTLVVCLQFVAWLLCCSCQKAVSDRLQLEVQSRSDGPTETSMVQSSKVLIARQQSRCFSLASYIFYYLANSQLFGTMLTLLVESKVPFFHAHLMADQIDLRSTLGSEIIAMTIFPSPISS